MGFDALSDLDLDEKVTDTIGREDRNVDDTE
jgi:hypothetical protein